MIISVISFVLVQSLWGIGFCSFTDCSGSVVLEFSWLTLLPYFHAHVRSNCRDGMELHCPSVLAFRSSLSELLPLMNGQGNAGSISLELGSGCRRTRCSTHLRSWLSNHCSRSLSFGSSDLLIFGITYGLSIRSVLSPSWAFPATGRRLFSTCRVPGSRFASHSRFVPIIWYHEHQVLPA